jgi:hypothetical protein
MRFDSRVSATEPKIPGRRIQKNIQEIKIPKRGPKKFQKRGALPKPVKPGRGGNAYEIGGGLIPDALQRLGRLALKSHAGLFRWEQKQA